MSETDPINKQEIVDIEFCLLVINPEHKQAIQRYYSDKFLTWDNVATEFGYSTRTTMVWRKNFKNLLNIILQHGDEFINLRQEALQA